ncbi:hypothetical protein ASF58_24565 [Methylobacterium sp. Leaf125]|uniref:hypothetical protein n=1 Tax=Methylobacterium sp. Leaf125 TaxID=1736265 RepID=UPI0006F92372|nr:hypothetical protein [Methylobacterium sp. Leaf125]KQQ27257.1 hypothetical protein ASF58_24565 [Methylobacterium sp. Leaf125]
MMHPPPEAFLQATEKRRAELERSQSSGLLRFLGWTVAVLLMLMVHVGLYLALTHVRRQMIWDIQRCSGAEALVHLG